MKKEKKYYDLEGLEVPRSVAQHQARIMEEMEVQREMIFSACGVPASRGGKDVGTGRLLAYGTGGEVLGGSEEFNKIWEESLAKGKGSIETINDLEEIRKIISVTSLLEPKIGRGWVQQIQEHMEENEREERERLKKEKDDG